jgi:hypothetical protein
VLSETANVNHTILDDRSRSVARKFSQFLEHILAADCLIDESGETFTADEMIDSARFELKF